MKKLILLAGFLLAVVVIVAATRVGWFSTPHAMTETVAASDIGSTTGTPADSDTIVDISTMSEDEIQLALRQGYCPVTLLKFMNMNVGGLRVKVQGQEVLVANTWARDKLLESPKKYLKVLKRWNEEKSLNQLVSDSTSDLSEEDQYLINEQKLCLVDNSILGAKGTPLKVVIQSTRINLRELFEPRTETTFVCCGECKTKLLESPEKFFDLLERNRLLDTRRDLSLLQTAEIEKAFSELSIESRAIAENQMICPVSEIRLGIAGQGAPIRVDVDGAVVMICCEGCRKELLNEPVKYFNKLRQYHLANAERSIANSTEWSRALPCTKLPYMNLPSFDLPRMELPK